MPPEDSSAVIPHLKSNAKGEKISKAGIEERTDVGEVDVALAADLLDLGEDVLNEQLALFLHVPGREVGSWRRGEKDLSVDETKQRTLRERSTFWARLARNFSMGRA